MLNRINLLDVEIDEISCEEAISRIEVMVREKVPSYVLTPNVDHLVKIQKDPVFHDIYKKASLVLADGVPLLWAARFLGTPLREKISGSDLFPKLCETAAQNGWRVFFMGGREGAAIKAAAVLRERFPCLNVAGTYCPPFGFEKDKTENEKIIGMIKSAKPDIVFVGLGAPKQEKWINQFKDAYGAPVSIGIGVSFEFVAGMVKRAPVWMQKIGMEWFWRLMMEPGRLWKRYLIDDMQFFRLVLKQKLKGQETLPKI